MKVLLNILLGLVAIIVLFFTVLIAMFKFWHHAIEMPYVSGLCSMSGFLRRMADSTDVTAIKKGIKLHTAAQCTKRTRIRILSLNMFLLPGPFTRHSTNDSKDERLEAFCKTYLASFDVVCLQECFSTFSTRYHRLVHMAREYGFNHVVFPEPPSLVSAELFDSGTTILSRYPILRRSWKPFPHATWPNLFASNGIMHALIDVGNANTGTKLVNVFNIHLQSYLTLRPSPSTLIAQELQLKTLWKRVNEVSHPRMPTVVCGDWNVDMNYGSNRKLVWKYAPVGFRMAIPHVFDDSKPKRYTHSSYFMGNNEVATLSSKVHPRDITRLKQVSMWLDHIFYRNVTVVTANIHTFVMNKHPYRCSDHDGVSTVIEL